MKFLGVCWRPQGRTLDFLSPVLCSSSLGCPSLTLSYTKQHNPPPPPPQVIVKIFSTRNAALLRGFEGSPDEFSVGQATSPGGGGAMAWPLFKWAGGAEDRYFAKMAPAGHAINVYTAPEMTLLDKKSVKLENIKEFSWSPIAPIMAAFQAESGNLPARICLLSFPGREEVRQKNLFSVADVKMIWHPEGEYLAVRVDQHTKTKKSVFTTFQIFR